ncbi:MAG: hypothetical protein AAFV85_12115 [Cyanobacteria bacterium J06634_6]
MTEASEADVSEAAVFAAGWPSGDLGGDVEDSELKMKALLFAGTAVI